MNEFCKEYIKQVKILFPVIRKPEKEYLLHLSVHLEDICEEFQINSLDALYEKYGRPEDVVREYFSKMDTEDIVRRIRQTRLFRIFVLWIVIAALAVTSAAAIKSVLYYKAYQEILSDIDGYWTEEIHE